MNELFFKKISTAISVGPLQAEPAPKPDLRSARQFDAGLDPEALTRIFIERAPASGSVTHQPVSSEDLAAKIREAVPAGATILIDPTLAWSAWLTALLCGKYKTVSLTDLDDEVLFNAEAVITGVDIAVAETASIVLANRALKLRLASLVPMIHFALIRPDQIVADLMDLPERFSKIYSGKTPAGITIISGPSKTSDIEMNLVIGVHGPGQMHMVFLPG